MSQKLKKVGSNLESDAQSIIISGNLSEIAESVGFLESDEDQDFDKEDLAEESKIGATVLENDTPSTLEDYHKVNQICEDLYGISLLDVFTKLLLNGNLDVDDFAVQSLVYKTQSLVRGSRGVR